MFTFVDNSVYNGPDTTISVVVLSTSQNVVAGNNIFVMLRWEGGTSSPTISDTAGNTYTLVDIAQLGATSGYVGLWYCLNCLGHATNVITCTHSAVRGFNRASASQFSSASSAAYVSSEKASAASTSISGSGLSASDDGMLIAGCGSFNSRVFTLAGDLANNRGGALTYATDGDVIFAGTGTKTASFTIPTSSSLGLVAALFSDAAAGGTTISNIAGSGGLAGHGSLITGPGGLVG